jgi:hypothetical protein
MFKSFSAFGAVAPKQLTVDDILAPLQAAIDKFGTLITQRETSIVDAERKVVELEEQIVVDEREISRARAAQEKFKSLLN